MDYKIFKQKETERIDYDFIRRAMKELGISYLSALLLSMKGIDRVEDAEMFLSPEFDDLNNPFLFNGMDILMERLEEAVIERQKVVLFSDYDCDGVTSAVILYRLLQNIGLEGKIIIPNRFTNGYGLNSETVKEIIGEKPDLVITSDNGISSIDEVKALKDAGIDVVVTDHHMPGEVLPEALAIINPKVEGELYPFRELCGAGVCFKIAQAAREHFSLNFDMTEMLVFAMIGTIADLVPLRDENRTLSKLGLYRLPVVKNEGLRTLIKKAGFDINNVNGGNIGFHIAPRINAAGRLSDAMEAVRLFLSEDEKEIDELSDRLTEYNDTRKDIEEGIFKRCLEIVEEESLLEKSPILFIRDDSFHEGVMGVAASSVVEKFNRPTVIMSAQDDEDGLIKASCRSIDGFDMFECLSASDGLFAKYGGHKAAAGFSIREENLEEMMERSVKKAYEDNIESLLPKSYRYDVVGIPSNLTMKSSRELDMFAPFGMGNTKPLIALKNVRITNPRRIGKNGGHLKFNIISKGRYYDCIAFKKGYLMEDTDFSKTFDVVFTMGINNFRDRENLQFSIKDIDYNSVNTRTFDKAAFSSFMYNLEGEDYFYPEEEDLLDDTLERTVERYRDAVLVLYNKDTYVRAVKYLTMKGYHYHTSYGFLSFNSGVVNILVLPTERIETDRKVVILDRPQYNDYEQEVYEGVEPIVLKAGIPVRNIRISRKFFLHMYKKFGSLKATGNNIYDFMNSIQSESDIEINYFTMRLALEVMKEMKLLNYSIENDKLLLKFLEFKTRKDIEKTKIMRKLKAR